MTEGLIRHLLGPQPSRVDFRLGGVEWVAWHAPAPVADNDAAAQAAQAAQMAEAADVRFFTGTGGSELWVIPGLPALDVIEFAKVGTHNGAADEWRMVRDFVSTVLAGIAFEVGFADEAGLELRMAAPISVEVARDLDTALLDRLERGDRLVDSYCCMVDRAVAFGLTPDPGADPRGGGQVVSFIVKTQSLRLWWD